MATILGLDGPKVRLSASNKTVSVEAQRREGPAIVD